MTLPADSQKAIDAYLAALRKHLRDLMDEDVQDIVQEIDAHILDKISSDTSAAAVAATLAALGTPEELASRYRTEELLKRAQSARSPAYLLRSLIRWAKLSVVGVAVFLISVVGYCIGGFLFILAALKLVWPRATGLWKTVNGDSSWGLNFGAGSGDPPANAHELLGWWLLPIGFILGAILLFLTFRLGTWSIRKFWRPRAWQ